MTIKVRVMAAGNRHEAELGDHTVGDEWVPPTVPYASGYRRTNTLTDKSVKALERRIVSTPSSPTRAAESRSLSFRANVWLGPFTLRLATDGCRCLRGV